MGTEKLTPNEHLAFIREEILLLQMKNVKIKQELEAQVKCKDKRIEEMLREKALYERAARDAFIPSLFFAVGFALASLLWWIF